MCQLLMDLDNPVYNILVRYAWCLLLFSKDNDSLFTIYKSSENLLCWNDCNLNMLCCRNIVCTVNLDCRLELKDIALRARNAEYNPKRFAAVIMRIRDPRTTALIFSSGKMVCTGAKRWVDITHYGGVKAAAMGR